MKVSSRLRGAFAIYIALLAFVALYHMRTIKRAIDSKNIMNPGKVLRLQ